ncbi:MAG TPA: gamma-glutamyltransferase [Acidimicrobiia bacterium]|nr:gamma-glutamyltransferase [Acidimicrobiia bacterium]
MGGLISGSTAIMAEQSTGRGIEGVVLAAAPMAAALGAEALRQGGNAFDAVVTAALAETVLLPPKCGLAGDLVALRLQSEQAQPDALLAIGGAPHRLAKIAERGELQVTGPASVGVPGAPAGYDLLATAGVLGRSRLAAPAIRIARRGFPWAQICTALAMEATDLVERHNPEGTVYFPDGAPIAPGAVVRLPGMAALLEEWVRRGAELFWGAVGDVVAGSVIRRGGVIEASDFRSVRAQWEPAATRMVGDRRLWATPAPTHGPSLLEALADARPGDGAGAIWDRVTKVIASRSDLLGDPSGTSMVSAADAAGNVVVVIHSNSFPRFGSGLVVDEFDLILNNRPGRGFSTNPGHPNFPAPGKRPATTLHAWAISNDRSIPQFLGGTPGGENQMPWNAQAVSQIIAGERDPGALVVAPRWEMLSDGGVAIEEGFDPDGIEELRSRATNTTVVPAFHLRCAQQVIARPPAGGVVVGGVDPRTGGAAVAV